MYKTKYHLIRLITLLVNLFLVNQVGFIVTPYFLLKIIISHFLHPKIINFVLSQQFIVKYILVLSDIKPQIFQNPKYLR